MTGTISATRLPRSVPKGGLDCRSAHCRIPPINSVMLSGGGFPRVFSSAGVRSRNILCFLPLVFSPAIRPGLVSRRATKQYLGGEAEDDEA